MAGRQAEKIWNSRDKPFKFEVAGNGNIREVETKNDFYKLVKITDDKYQVIFKPIDKEDGKSLRHVQFSSKLLKREARILDDNNEEISKIDNVDKEHMIFVHLN